MSTTEKPPVAPSAEASSSLLRPLVEDLHARRAQIELGGGVQYMGQRYMNNTNTVQAPQFFRFDAMAAYHFPTFDIRLNVFNLTDEKFYDNVIGSDGGRAVPGSGRTAMLTLSKRF